MESIGRAFGSFRNLLKKLWSPGGNQPHARRAGTLSRAPYVFNFDKITFKLIDPSVVHFIGHMPISRLADRRPLRRASLRGFRRACRLPEFGYHLIHFGRSGSFCLPRGSRDGKYDTDLPVQWVVVEFIEGLGNFNRRQRMGQQSQSFYVRASCRQRYRCCVHTVNVAEKVSELHFALHL